MTDGRAVRNAAHVLRVSANEVGVRHLAVVQACVQSTFAMDEFLMPARFDNRSTIEHDHAVRATDGAEPMRDDQRCSALQQLFQRVLDESLAFRVEARRGVVEDDDGRIAQEHPRNRDALSLAARKLHATFANAGCPLGREPLNEFPRMRSLCGG